GKNRSQGLPRRIAGGHGTGKPGRHFSYADCQTSAPMTTASSTQPTFWRTVGVLLGAARQRAKGRKERSRQLLQHRAGNSSVSDWGAIGFRLTAIFLAIINVLAAVVLKDAFSSAQRVEAQHQGKVVVSRSFFDAAKAEADYETSRKNLERCYLWN